MEAAPAAQPFVSAVAANDANMLSMSYFYRTTGYVAAHNALITQCRRILLGHCLSTLGDFEPLSVPSAEMMLPTLRRSMWSSRDMAR